MDSPDDSKNWCKTQNKIAKFDFTWTIENFSFCSQKLGKYLRSSIFRDDEQHINWCLDLYPKGEESKDWVALLLRLLPNQKTTPVIAKFKFAILKANGKQANEKNWPEVCKFGTKHWAWGYSKFIGRDFLLGPRNGLLPDDQLSIFCEVSIFVETVNVSSQSESPSIPQFCLSNDMSSLLEKGLFTDCVLCSGDGKEFQVHKVILASRSPVFAAMFTNDTEESRTNRVNIGDISAPVLGQLLHFLYTGCEPKLEQDVAEGLLVAADKYQLDRLKAICEQQLSKGINKDNVCKMLVLADLHSAEHLKLRVTNYLNLHADEVVESEGWRTLVASNTELLKLVLKSKVLPNTANQILPPKRQKTPGQRCSIL